MISDTDPATHPDARDRSLRRAYRYRLAVAISALIGSSFIAFTLYGRPWSDELHFVETVRLFRDGVTLDLLRSYGEMSGPLPFVVYGSWSRVFGASLTAVRSLSLLVAFVTYLLFYELATDLGARPRAAFWTTIWWAANPYMLGLSALVYTDMIAIMCAIAGCFAIRRRRPGLWAAATAGALVSRVYMVFVVAAAVVWLVGQRRSRPAPEIRKFLWATAAGVTPLAALVAVWNWGLSPVNTLRSVYLNAPGGYHIGFLSLYVGLLAPYLLPLLVMRRRLLYRPATLVIGCCVAAVLSLWPVGPAPPQVAAGVATVGLLDRALHATLGSALAIQLVWSAMQVFGVALICRAVSDVLPPWPRPFAALLSLCVLSFFLVMPFGYMPWEKYFLPLVPFASLRLAVDEPPP